MNYEETIFRLELLWSYGILTTDVASILLKDSRKADLQCSPSKPSTFVYSSYIADLISRLIDFDDYELYDVIFQGLDELWVDCKTVVSDFCGRRETP